MGSLNETKVAFSLDAAQSTVDLPGSIGSLNDVDLSLARAKDDATEALTHRLPPGGGDGNTRHTGMVSALSSMGAVPHGPVQHSVCLIPIQPSHTSRSAA